MRWSPAGLSRWSRRSVGYPGVSHTRYAFPLRLPPRGAGAARGEAEREGIDGMAGSL